MKQRFATASDILKFYGERPPQTLKAIIVVLDEEPIAVVGLSNEGGYGKFFSEYKPELRGRLRRMAVLRAIKAAMEFVERCPMPVVAVTHPEEPDSPRLLQKLGFEFHEHSDNGDIYQWPG
jgi:hypothetical protein